MADPAFWSGRRVLLTGHTGFKGGWLALWLSKLGAQVTGLSLGTPSTPSLFEVAGVARALEGGRGEHCEADVRDADGVAAAVVRARPEVVIHMAAQALVRRSFEDPAATYAINVVGTANVLQAVHRLAPGARAVLVVTSDKCYANRDWEWSYREPDALGGRDPYSSSKAAQELVAATYRDSFELPVATARAGNVIGGGDWALDRLVPDIVRAVDSGRPLMVRSPAAVRPWQHVLNPLSGYLTLLERLWEDPACATAWNFGPGDADAQSVRRVVERVRERSSVSFGVRWSETEGDEAGQLRLDSSRARARLGWRPRWDLARGIDATVDWYDGLRRGQDALKLTMAQIEEFERA